MCRLSITGAFEEIVDTPSRNFPAVPIGRLLRLNSASALDSRSERQSRQRIHPRRQDFPNNLFSALRGSNPELFEPRRLESTT